MTLLIADVSQDSVSILTDSAILNPDGSVDGLVSKCMALPQQNVILAANGTLTLSSLAFVAFAKLNGLDAMRQRGPDLLRKTFEVALPAFSAQAGPDVLKGTIVVASAGRAFLITTHNLIPSLRPWTAIDVAGRFITPTDDSIDATMIATDDLTDECAVEVAERCRHINTTDSSLGKFGCLVGGALVRNTIDASGIHSCVLHRWPDKIGAKLNS